MGGLESVERSAGSCKERLPADMIRAGGAVLVDLSQEHDLASRRESLVDGHVEAIAGRIAGDPLLSLIYKSVSDGIVPAGIEYYLPLYFDKLVTIFDYLPDEALFILPQQLEDDIQDI